MWLAASIFLARRMSSVSITAALQGFIESSFPSNGLPIHAHIIKSGCRPGTNVSIKLLILYLRCGSLIQARKVFDEMPQPTLSAFNYLISGYFKAGISVESLNLARNLSFSGQKPDGFTFSMILKLSATMGTLYIAKQTHTQIIKSEIESDDVVFAALIDSYVKNEIIDYARSVFYALPKRSLVCSTALIVGYMNQRLFRDAEDIFSSLVEKDVVIYNAMMEGYSRIWETASRSLQFYKLMRLEGFIPTVSTAVSVIGACSLLPALEFGQQIHCEIIKTTTYSHVKAGSALIDMYCKCGGLEDARRIFDHMPEKNVFSWTSMIDGYGKNGYSHDALGLFYKMKTYNEVKPNCTTFLSVLSACGHAGLVSEGQKIFESMDKDYGLKPRMEHYACMVDLFGRAGHLLEAYDFIKRIPHKLNSDAWASLLGASRVHGDVEMADIAAKELFMLCRNERPAAYIALSNTFAAAGMWDCVCQVRELMKDRRVSANTGYSWVGSEEGLHGFLCGRSIS